MKCTLYFLLLSFPILFSTCKDKEDPEPEPYDCELSVVWANGNRTIGIDLLNLTETNTFEDNITIAKDMHMQFIALHTTWSGLEPSPNNYTDPFNAIALLAQAAQDNDMRFSLTIRPIDITGKTIPSDLESKRFSDPEMITRFKSLIDYVFTLLDTDVLINLQIGNEIDGYDISTETSTFWEDYGHFLREIRDYIHTKDGNVKVGFTGTYHGLIKQKSIFVSMADSVDILGVTYYPLKPDFTVEEPNIVYWHLDTLVTTYDRKVIHLQEVGYQSSEVCNSSNDKQAEFFCHFFDAWDSYKSNILSANVVRMNDLSRADAEAAAGPYGITNEAFIEYLRTIGIRSEGGNGTNKKALEVIKKNMHARGW